MPTFAPTTLAAWTGGTWHGPTAVPVVGFGIDTRTLGAGQMFVALTTEKRDGHDFLGAAQQAGATAALVRRHVAEVALPQLVVADPLAALQEMARRHRLDFRGPVLGVTGSCGKTSTKELLAHLLGALGEVHRTAGNLNNHLGVPLTLLGLDPQRHAAAVVEAGMNSPGEIEALARLIAPDVGVVTMVGPAHLERLGSLEAIAHEKSALLRGTRPHGLLAFPADCLNYADFRALLPEAPEVVAQADAALPVPPPLHLRRFRSESRPGGEARLVLAEGALEVSLPLPGPLSPGMLSNVALAVTVAERLGVKLLTLAERLPRWRAASLRGEILPDGPRSLYVDCYNANPASMADAFLAFAAAFPGPEPRLYILGSMGELGPAAPALHRATTARLTLRPDDRAVLVGPEATALAEGLAEAGAPATAITIVGSAGEVRPSLQQWVGPVLLKGSRFNQLESLLPSKTSPLH